MHPANPVWSLLTSPRRREGTPARLVIEPALRLAQERPCLQVRDEVDQPDLGAPALDFADGGAHGGLVGAALSEEPPELRLGLEEPSTRGTRRGEHRVHEGARRRLLLWRERQALFQLEHVHGTGIAVLVGGEGQAEAAPLAPDRPEPRQARLRRL